MKNLMKEYKEINLTYEAMSSNLKMKNYYEDRKIQLLDQIKLKNFNNVMLQEQIIDLINNHCIKNNISINNIFFSDKNAVDCAEEDIEQLDIKPFEIQRVTVEFKCSYENLLLFIDTIKNSNVDIAITNIRVINWGDDIIYVTSDLNFYFFNIKV